MELTINERLLLLNVLPDKGDFTTLRIVRDLQLALSFSEEEHDEFKIVRVGDSISWNKESAKAKNVEIGPRASILISDTLKKLSEDKALSIQYLALYEKFVDI